MMETEVPQTHLEVKNPDFRDTRNSFKILQQPCQLIAGLNF